MNKALARTIALAMSLLLEFAPLAAQQRKDPPAAPKQTTRARPEMPAPTFDTLLAADDYKVYGEIKNVGQLIRSANVADILDPILKLGGPPKEFKSLVKFANAHAEVLTTARMLIAFWPAKTKLPQALFAIEFSSPEEASKFEPQLREFLPSILPQPTPTPTVETTEAIKDSGATGATKTTEVAATKPTEAPPPPFVLKQFGKLVLISDTTVNFKDLRPADSKPLFDDQNFRQAYDRFASEQIFLYFNVALNERGRATAGEAQVSVAGPMADQPKIDEPAEMSNDDSKDQDGPEALPDLQTAEMQSPPMATVTLEAGPPAGVGFGSISQEQRTVVTVEA